MELRYGPVRAVVLVIYTEVIQPRYNHRLSRPLGDKFPIRMLNMLAPIHE